MKEELVDILLTTYNSNLEYIVKQLDSLLCQTYSNIRIYISDDKSGDFALKEILKKYEEKDKRIKLYLQKQNIGVNKNFEFLLKQSTANYIMFCDHDDIWYPQKVEESLKTIINEKVDLAYCDARQINEKDQVISNSYLKSKSLSKFKGKLNKKVMARHTVIGCSQIITKEVKEKMLPFKPEVIAHDWLSVTIANEGKGIVYIDKPLLDYRLHGNNIFGGRTTNQNLCKWKENNKSDYKSFLEYRKNTIEKAYEKGAIMCGQYCKDCTMKKQSENIIKYYESLKKSKYINFHLIKYIKFLAGKNILKRMVKEIALFHLPILAYIKFKINR